jgi:hypothetical protein
LILVKHFPDAAARRTSDDLICRNALAQAGQAELIQTRRPNGRAAKEESMHDRALFRRCGHPSRSA